MFAVSLLRVLGTIEEEDYTDIVAGEATPPNDTDVDIDEDLLSE